MSKLGKAMMKDKFNSYGEKVLSTGQADDLISESDSRRVWRSRIDNKLSEERFNKKTDRWEMI
ncbi:MAG TPA: hypothetical protein VMZ91_01570 [Candidatus Paceibacterota bacterium]|nr:hypothetical protein [Candidatus Paceibacterota bacterium]